MNEQVGSAVGFKQPWYHWHRFSVLPQFKFRPANKHNTAGFQFHWLAFRAWSMDSTEFSAQATLDDQNLDVRVHLPYLIAGLFIPIFPRSFMMKLWRRPAARSWE